MPLQMSTILFSDVPALSGHGIRQAIARLFPGLPGATEAAEQGNTVSFQVGAADVILGVMPAPVPWSDLEGPCATSILWRDAARALQGHAGHVLVTVSGPLGAIELATLLTQATAAVMAASPTALGVLWTSAALLVPKDMFIDFATQALPHGPPLHIWVDFRVGRAGEGASAGFTTGMAEFGHMEFEVQHAPESPAELRERLMALAGYVMENGAVLKDGDTVGGDARERIRIVYSPSSFGQKNQVLRLVFEPAAAGKPWWKRW